MARLALALIFLVLAAVPTTAKPAPVVFQIELHFQGPKGAKIWTYELAYMPGADKAAAYCAGDISKDQSKVAKNMAVDQRELTGLTYVSANCVMKNGAVRITSNFTMKPKPPTPVGVGMYYDDGGRVHATLFQDPARPISMLECKPQLSALTTKFKKNIADNFPDFDGMKFVRSECVFVQDFKF